MRLTPFILNGGRRLQRSRGLLLTGGVGTMGGPLAGVIENIINQVGTLSPYYQNLASGAFLLVAVVAQTLLTGSRKG